MPHCISALRLDLRRRQVPEYLAVRRPGPAPVLPVSGVESEAEPLALFDDDGVPVSRLSVASCGSALLRGGVGEQQKVRDVLVACRALLRQVVRPPQKLQHRADQLLLGHRLVRVRRAAQSIVTLPHAVPERVERRGVRDGSPPLVRGPYALGQEVLCEQVARHISSCAAPFGNLDGVTVPTSSSPRHLRPPAKREVHTPLKGCAVGAGFKPHLFQLGPVHTNREYRR